MVGVSKVIQIRDVPDDVHAALVDAAESEGLSLTRYTLRELEHVARRARAVSDNAATVKRTQDAVNGSVHRQEILDALHEGRGD
jgi:hypothetical protein